MARRVSLSEPEKACKIVEEDGCCILTDFTSLEDVQQVNIDAEPYLQAYHTEETASDLPVDEIIICTRLFGRSRTAREVWMQQPNLHKMLNHFIRTTTTLFVGDAGEEHETLSTDPILSNSNTLVRLPGAAMAKFHRDDYPWQHINTDRERAGFVPGSDIAASILVPGIDANAENGSTVFVPKSHLWGHKRVPKIEEAVSADMNTGEALFILGSLVHGGGPNRTQQKRPVHAFFFIRSYLRPEDNQHLWWKKEEVEEWSTAAQRQAGYVMGSPNIGHTEWRDPISKFRASETAVTA